MDNKEDVDTGGSMVQSHSNDPSSDATLRLGVRGVPVVTVSNPLISEYVKQAFPGN